MWSVGTKAHDVYLGSRAAAVCTGDEALLSHAATDFEEALAVLSSWLQEAPARRKLRVWLSGGLCRPLIVPSVPGIRGELELQRMASALAPQHTGLMGPCRVWVDTARGDVSRVAAAMQESRLEQLLALLNATGRHSVVSIRPWWADMLRAALKRDPELRALATQDCDSLTVLVGEVGKNGTFALVTTLAPVVDRDTADSALARLLLSSDVEQGQEVVGRLLLQSRDVAETPKIDAALSPLTEWSR